MASSTSNQLQPELPRGRKKRHQPRDPSVDSSTPRTRGTRRRAEPATEVFYKVKSIIDESSQKYLIDWEDDPVTGESYSPTWEPKGNANDFAVEVWQKKQAGEDQSQSKEKTIIDTSEDFDEDSEPIRSAKRKRVARVGTRLHESNSSPDLVTKRPRLRAGIRKSARLSQGEGLRKGEVEDSYEGEAESTPGRGQDEVELSVPSDPSSTDTTNRTRAENPTAPEISGTGSIIDSNHGTGIEVAISFHGSIDTTAYVNVTANSSLQSLSTDLRTRLQSSVNSQKFSGQDSTEAEIPDSQGIPRPSKNLSQSQNTTQTTTSTKDSGNSISSGENQDNFPVNGPLSAKNIEKLHQNSGENPILTHSDHRDTTESEEASRQSYISWLSVKPFSNHSSVDIHEHQATSGTSKESHNSDSLALIDESQHSLSVRSSDEQDYIVGTSLNSAEKQSAPARELEIPDSEEQSTSQSQSALVGEKSFESDKVADKSTSGFEEIWQGAQIVSPVHPPPTQPNSPNGTNFEIFQDNTASIARENSQGSTSRAVLSQQDGNSTKGCSQSRDPEVTSQNVIADSHSQKSISRSTHSRDIRASNTEAEQETTNFASFLPAHPITSSGVPELPETYGSSTPRRPRPLSYSDMSGGQDSMDLESNASGGVKALSVREQMRLRRAESAASRPITITRTLSDAPATNSSLAMPPAVSTIPVLPSVPTVPSTRSSPLTPARVSSPQLPVVSVNQAAVQSNQMLPNRGVMSAPHLPLNPRVAYNAPPKEDKDFNITHSKELPGLGAREYIVPLPMMSNIRKIYETIIRNNKREIQEFTSNETKDPQLDVKMEKMIDMLKKLGDHQDINTEISPSQASMSDDIVKKWAETCSTKCAFIRELLDALRTVKVHVAILARPGRMLDILEAMFRSQKYLYDRPDQRRSNQNGAGLLRVTLLPTGNDGGLEYVPTRADIVIAFDETFKLGERYSSMLRSGDHIYDKPSPLLFLVVTNSAEHLELCIPQPSTKSRERTQALVNAIVERRHEVGKLDVEDFQPDQAAVRVARYLTSLASGADSLWPLPPIDEIPGLDFTNVQFRPDSTTTMSSTQSSGHMQVPQVPRSSIKRSWDGSESTDADSTKRARSTPVPGETNASAEVSRVSDTVSSQSQMRPGATVTNENSRDSSVKYEYQDLAAQNAALLAQVAALSSKVTDLESQLLSKQQAISNLYKVVRERDHSIEVNIAPKYQEAIKDSAIARHALEEISEQNEALKTRGEQRDAEIKKLKEEKSTIQDELNTARTALSSSAIPEVAELAKKDEEIRALKEANERQEKKTASAEKLVDFIKDQYQTASNAAAEYSSQIASKDAIIADLTRKADENRVICAQAQAASEKEESDQRISELEALLQDREDELARKREELKARSNRRETRGSSVPRSPAMMASPRVAGSRSRAGSPAVGELPPGRDGRRFYRQLYNANANSNTD